MSESYSQAGDSYSAWAGTAGAADNAVIYTSGDISKFNYHTIAVTGTSPSDVEVTIDGTTWHVASVTLIDNVTTGGGIQVITIPTGKMGYIRGKFKQLRVIEDGATDSDAFGAHSWA